MRRGSCVYGRLIIYYQMISSRTGQTSKASQALSICLIPQNLLERRSRSLARPPSESENSCQNVSLLYLVLLWKGDFKKTETPSSLVGDRTF